MATSALPPSLMTTIPLWRHRVMTPQCRRIAAIGECMIELTDAGTAPNGAGGLRRGFGGDTLNTAVYMARIARTGAGPGIGVDYVSPLGDDPFSDEMLAAWRAEGIGTIGRASCREGVCRYGWISVVAVPLK